MDATGDSALEAATSICELEGTHVTRSYRGAVFDRAKAQNRERVAKADRDGRLRVLMKSQIRQINTESVLVDTPHETLDIANDAVIVSAGGILPGDFLKSVGIDVETKFGTA